MTTSAPSDGEVAALRQKIALLEQGMGQAARIRELWEKSASDLKATKSELSHSLQELAEAHDELTEKSEALERLNDQLREELAFREKVEAERLLSQKLESIGQLAAGIAHEINTPIQYVSDNTHFLRSAFASLQQLVVALDPEKDVAEGSEPARLAAVLDVAESEALLEIEASPVASQGRCGRVTPAQLHSRTANGACRTVSPCRYPCSRRVRGPSALRMSTGGEILRSYELMMIHRPELAEPDVRTLVGEVEGVIASSGSVEDTDFWGKRRFAYEIDHLNEGFYSVVTFEAGTEMVETLDRALGLHDAVIRHKITRSAGK